MIISLIASAVALTTVQSAAEWEEACNAFQAEYGGEADCSCLAEAVASDDDLAAMFADITSPEDIASAPAEVIEAIENCS